MIECGEMAEEAAAALGTLFWGTPAEFSLWLGERFAERIHPFERGAIETELEVLKEFSKRKCQGEKNGRQLALL